MYVCVTYVLTRRLCVLQDGLVVCDHERCKMTETCHLLLLGQRIRPESCCEQCKGEWPAATAGVTLGWAVEHSPVEPCRYRERERQTLEMAVDDGTVSRGSTPGCEVHGYSGAFLLDRSACSR